MSGLVSRLDTMAGPAEKLAALGNWLLEAHALDHVLVLNFRTGELIRAGRLEAASLETERLFPFLESLPRQAALVPGKTGEAAVLAPLLNGSKEFVYYPLADASGKLLGALCLIAKKPAEYLAERINEIRLAAATLRDLLLIQSLDRDAADRPRPAVERQPTPAPSPDTLPTGSDLPGLKHFIDLMNYPMFVLDLEGELLTVNPNLLLKLKFESQAEFVRRCELFRDLFQRGDLLRNLTRDGGVRGKRCTLTDAAGERVTLNLSAVCLDRFIVASLFDVSEFVRVTDDLRESLKMQEFLNDKLISANLLLHKTKSTTIRSLALLAEFRDQHTGDHLKRICEYSRLIAREILKRQPYPDYKIRSESPDDIFLASMLHDIGKVAIPDTILLKAGKLTPEEREVMKRHTILGWEILNRADCELGEQSFLTLASHIALNHHEHWDGSGYPYGIAGERISHSARISAVADVYDALTSRRPYKQPWSHEDSLAEIKSKAGVYFDPVVVDMLLGVEKKMLDIHRQFPK